MKLEYGDAGRTTASKQSGAFQKIVENLDDFRVAEFWSVLRRLNK
jgi:hypothetical protein